MRMRTCVLGAVGLFALALHAPEVLADFKDDIGYTALVDRGEVLPDGSGMAVIQVEVESDTGRYMPTLTDPEFVGKTITPRSGPSDATTHAKIVGWYFYGLTTSMTPGISTIDVYEASGYMGSDSLKTGDNNNAPTDLSAFDVMNHSWIGTWGGSDNEVLRRLDWQIADSGIVATVGVNNVSSETGPWIGQDMPRLLSSSYNAIAVGVSSLYNSNGPTPIDVPGRAKPDLVAPGGFTSWASPMVGSAAAILLAQAGNQGWAAAEDPRTIKSILMTGTEKSRHTYWRGDGVIIPPWQKGVAGTADDEAYPLDLYQGAGSVRLDRAWDILNAGPQSEGGDVFVSGWNFDTVEEDDVHTYSFELQGNAQFTAVATWYRNVRGMVGNNFNTSVRLADIDLMLRREGEGGYVQLSASTIDNVEHVWVPELAAGNYILEVIGDTGMDEDYAVGWHTMFLGDADDDRDVDGTDLAMLGLSWAPASTDKHWIDGDFDGDGDVDGVDLATLGTNWSPMSLIDSPWLIPTGVGGEEAAAMSESLSADGFASGLSTGQVPEPATAVLVGLGMGVAAFLRRRARRF